MLTWSREATFSRLSPVPRSRLNSYSNVNYVTTLTVLIKFGQITSKLFTWRRHDCDERREELLREPNQQGDRVRMVAESPVIGASNRSLSWPALGFGPSCTRMPIKCLTWCLTRTGPSPTGRWVWHLSGSARWYWARRLLVTKSTSNGHKLSVYSSNSVVSTCKHASNIAKLCASTILQSLHSGYLWLKVLSLDHDILSAFDIIAKLSCRTLSNFVPGWRGAVRSPISQKEFPVIDSEERQS